MSDSRGIRSIGVLHPTFESWGGAEWFIHQSLVSLLAGSRIRATVYTHRWTPPPGETVPYQVVCHRRGGVLTAPWDWEKIAREQAGLWREHSLLFVHNWPATLWYQEGSRLGPLPPAV
ncbi:MAG TPA: hypothetical protein VNI57_04920, partial [Candidatus Saccharimonadales bacterium]|nr:hypothetical protein [Candidatus Saccharimonadales bacterium]